MTKFTIEDLRDIAYRGSYDELERELALQLLASMEQAPVYLRPFGDDGETFVACDGDDELAITLYAAPQLPQPAALSVPDGVLKSLLPDAEKSEFWFEHNGKIFFEGLKFNNAVFEACRAAMLQAGNSPVTPDGWIPVSERMPNKLIPVMVMYEDGEMWSAMWNGNRWDDGTEYPDPHSVTHWRKMPAAPQQEVK